MASSIAMRVAARFLFAHDVHILIDRDATNGVRAKGAREAIVGTFESSAALYRIFDGEELRRIVGTGKITGGMYSVKLERAHGASWGTDISAIISWGNHQRGKRLGDDLFLAKIDALDKRFFHLDPKVADFDPDGPTEQPASMDIARCSAGLGCSIVDATFQEATLYRVGTGGQMESISDAEIHEYLAAKPAKDVELRQVSQVYYTGSIHGEDVIVLKNQEHHENQWGVRNQGPYYGTWQVETRDEKVIVKGVKTMEAAVEHATRELHDGWHGFVVDLLPKTRLREWQRKQKKPAFYAEAFMHNVLGQHMGYQHESARRVLARFLEAARPVDHESEKLAFAVRVAAKYKQKVKTEAGNTVYTYSERQITNRNNKKAERIEKLRKSIGKLRTKVKRDLHSQDPEKTLLALAVALMDHTYERVGNDESAKDGHVGVTGWCKKHVSFGGKGATIKYVGKSGVKHEKKITDTAIRTALKDAYDAVEGDDAEILSWDGGRVTAEKVNKYLDAFDITAKDLRGFHANREMQDRLKAARKAGGKLPVDKKKRAQKLKDEFKRALDEASDAVGHEASTLRSQYLVPGIEESFLKDGTVSDKLGAMDDTLVSLED